MKTTNTDPNIGGTRFIHKMTAGLMRLERARGILEAEGWSDEWRAAIDKQPDSSGQCTRAERVKT
jgi:hypothetical protein